MTENAQALVDALVRFASEATAVLHDRFGEPSIGPALYWDWERTSDEVFAASERSAWDPRESIRAWESIQRLDSYSAAVELLEADARTKGQLGQLVGTARGQSTLVHEWIFMGDLLSPAISQSGTFDLDADALRPHAARLVRSLAADHVEFRELVQVLGVVSDEADVEVAEGVVFRLLTDSELAALLRFNVAVLPMRQHTIAPGVRMVPREQQFGLVATSQLPKVIGQAEDVEAFDPTGITEIADAFVTAVRLRTRSSVSRGGPVAFSGGWKSEPWQQANFGTAPAPPSVDRVDLPAAELSDITDLSRQLRLPAVQQRHGIALRRFRELPLRSTVEDKLVDLIIAAEAMYQPGRRRPERELARRTADFVTDSGTAPPAVERFMKSAYGLRSDVVHGAEPRKPRRLDGAAGSLANVVEDLELVMGLGISKAVTREGRMPSW